MKKPLVLIIFTVVFSCSLVSINDVVISGSFSDAERVEINGTIEYHINHDMPVGITSMQCKMIILPNIDNCVSLISHNITVHPHILDNRFLIIDPNGIIKPFYQYRISYERKKL